MKKFIALLLVLCMVFAMSACGSSGSGDQGGDSAEAKDSLVIGIDSDAVALDPLAINDTVTMNILTNVYEPLVRMTPDSQIVPALATSWDISEDGLEYVFTIRTDATFHDGSPITAEDVKYSLDAAIASDYTGPYMNYIDKVEVLAEDQVKVTLQYAYAPFLALCTIYSEVVKEDSYADGGATQAKNPIGSGPYKFVNWAQGDKIEFEAYDGYYGGEAAIKKLTYKIISNSTTACLALESGEIDVSMNVASADIASLEGKDGITLLKEPSSAFYFIGMNANCESLKDVKVRQAISMAINKDDLILGALDGYGVKTNTFIAEGLPGYRADFDPYPYDIEKAKQLLAEAGYPDGFDLTISVPESRSIHAQMFKSDLAKIGINLEIGILESGAFWDKLEGLDYEMMMMGWSYVAMDPDVGYYSLYKKDDLSGNYTGFGDDYSDGLLEKGRTATSAEERDAIYAELEQLVADSAVYVPLYWRMDVVAFNSALQGIQIPPCGLYYVYDFAW